MVGLPGLAIGARWPAFGLTTLLLAGMGLGVAMEAAWPVLLRGTAPVRRPDVATARALWGEAWRSIREFPLVGSGLGTSPRSIPYFKDLDMSSTTAMSSLLQWGVEAGAAGLGPPRRGRLVVPVPPARRAEAGGLEPIAPSRLA